MLSCTWHKAVLLPCGSGSQFCGSVQGAYCNFMGPGLVESKALQPIDIYPQEHVSLVSVGEVTINGECHSKALKSEGHTAIGNDKMDKQALQTMFLHFAARTLQHA